MGRDADFNWLRKQAKDKKSKERINEIERDHRLVFEEGKIIRGMKLFDVNLGKYKIWFRKGGAYSSIDIYTEIFKENDHMLVPEFSGKNAKLIIDLGANEGYYTLKIKQNNPKCKILAVEPNPYAFRILKKNVKSNNLKDIILVNKAVSAKNEEISFEIVPEVSAIGAKDIRLQKRPWLREERIQKITVEGIKLPNLCKKNSIDKADILKIDVEGAEMEILRTSKGFLKNIKKIVVEWHTEKLRDEVKEFLKDNDFKLVFEEKRQCGNLYFINKNL